MLHNVAAMLRKECQRHSQGSQLEMTELAPEHLFMQTLLGSPDSVILKVAEQVYGGVCSSTHHTSTADNKMMCMRELCQELTRCMTKAGLRIAELGQLGPL